MDNNRSYFSNIKNINSFVDIVKELVENSIDAGASIIEINFDKLFSKIECLDNGNGFSNSAIFDILSNKNFPDHKNYSNPSSLGFRNEALYSIFKLSSDLQVTYKENNDTYVYSFLNGKKPSPNYNKTSVKVDYPFKNTSVLNFINISSEVRLIYDLIDKYSMHFSDVQFIINGSSIYPKMRAENINHLSGTFLYNNDVVSFDVEYFISHYSRSIVFMDNRLIHNEKVSSIIKKSLKSVLNKNAVHIQCYARISSSNNDIIHISHSVKKSFAKTTTLFDKLLESSLKDSISNQYKDLSLVNIKNIGLNDFSNAELDDKYFDKVLGQVFNSFILAEKDNALFLFDQHAIHERIIFNNFQSQMSGQNFSLHTLQNKIFICDDIRSILFFEKYLQEFEALGFEFLISSSDVFLSKIPKNFTYIPSFEWQEILLRLIEETVSEKNFLNIVFDLANYTCKKAIKLNFTLSEQEIINFINQMSYSEYISFCNHGRNSIIKISKEKLLSFFDR